MYQVFIWEATGTVGALVSSGMEAEKIHEKGGADVSINIDQMNRMHYVMSFDSWEAWGKYMARQANDEEWNAFVAEASQRQIATLTKVWRLNLMQFE